MKWGYLIKKKGSVLGGGSDWKDRVSNKDGRRDGRLEGWFYSGRIPKKE